jgi:hypothetical protein
MRRIVLVVSVVALALSCKREDSVRFDLIAVKVVAQQRMERVMRQPAINAALDQLIAAIGADPQLRERGTSLLTSLGADPTVAKSVEHLLTTVQASPGVQSSVRDLMKSNPGASADDIGAMVGKRAETNWASKGITDAWMRGWNRFLPLLHVGAVPAIFDSAIGKRFEDYIAKNGDRWSERLVKLNGGSQPAPARTVELYFDHAWSEPRLEQFATDALRAPQLQAECIAALRRMLDIATVRDALREAAVTIAGDATVQDAAVKVIEQLILANPDADVIGRELDRFLQAPPTAPAVNKLMTRVLGDPQVPKIIVDGFEHLRGDPKLAAAVEQLLDHW